jgi:proteasome accessory factor A
MAMYRRIFGGEQEYLLVASCYGVPVVTDLQLICPADDQWGRNGCRAYRDVGEHPEYATPELVNPMQAVSYTLAGHAEMAERVRRYVEKERRSNSSFHAMLCANNGDSRTITYGTHENYMYPKSIMGLRWYCDPILPYLATRLVIFGTGEYHIDVWGDGHLNLSQRARHMLEPVANTTTRSRGFISERDEPHLGRANVEFGRLHVIEGSAQILPQLIGLKYATMCVLMSMREEGKLEGLPLGTFTADKDMMALHHGANKNPGFKIYVVNHGRLSAVDVQRWYFDQALSYVDATPEMAEFRPWIIIWGEHLDRLEESLDPEAHYGLLDWATKFRIMERWLSREANVRARADLDPEQWYERVHALEQSFHTLNDPGSLYWKIVNRFGRYDPAEVALAVDTPPSNTRAHVRGWAASLPPVPHIVRSFNWSLITVGTKHFGINDPFCAKITEDMLKSELKSHPK